MAMMATVTLLVGTATLSVDPRQPPATGSISGIVTAPNGTGVPQADVFATPYDGSLGLASTTTARTGVIR
jgi:hypothetical protein